MRFWLIIALVFAPFAVRAQSIGTSSSPTSDNLLQIAGSPISLGQTVRANSLPVTIASDQAPFTDNLVQIGGFPVSLGQQVRGKSIPVTMAWDQPAIPVFEPNVTPASPLPVAQTDVRGVDVLLDSSVSNNAITVPLSNGAAVIAWQVKGLAASTATLSSECTTSYFSASPVWVVCTTYAGGFYAQPSNNLTLDSRYDAPVSAYNAARLRVSTTGSGIVTVNYVVSTAPTVVRAARVFPTPANNTGISVATFQIANNTTSFAVDASQGNLYGISAFNNSATIAYIKLYNAAQGSVTCGSGTPADRLLIPASSTGAGFIWQVTHGVEYPTAITACVTTGYADSDATAPAANTYLVSFYYK